MREIKKNKALFLDRDGVINVEKDYAYKIEDFEFLPTVFTTCQAAIEKGYMIVIVTNQSGVGRGFYSVDDFQKLTEWMCKKFAENQVKISGVYACFHAPHEICECRKPQPGMILQAAKDLEIDLADSFLVGDKVSDIKAANVAKVGNAFLISTGHDLFKREGLILNKLSDILKYL